MIKVLVLKQNKTILAIEATGHSGYANEGSDIVCSAISTLIQNLTLGLTKLINIKPIVTQDQELPFYSVALPQLTANQMHDAQLLMQSAYLGIKEIANQFTKYVSIKEKNK